MNISITTETSEEDRERIDAGLDAFNQGNAPLHEVVPLAVAARADDRVIGGAVGRTWGECAELLRLWVDEPSRRGGVGTQLMQRFESVAIDRGCQLIYLDTFTFQAPRFYESLGYEMVACFAGFGHGIERRIYQKRVGLT